MPTKEEIRASCPKYKKGKCREGIYDPIYCGEIPCCDCRMISTCEVENC